MRPDEDMQDLLERSELRDPRAISPSVEDTFGIDAPNSECLLPTIPSAGGDALCAAYMLEAMEGH